MFEVVAILDGSEMELKEIFGVDDLLKKVVGSPSSDWNGPYVTPARLLMGTR